MNFFEWNSQYKLAKDLDHKRAKAYGDTELSWYANMIAYLHSGQAQLADMRIGNTIANLQAEMDWFAFGEPYYKVFPTMASMMSDISIDIPSNQLLLPYPSFVIMLADDHRNDFRENGRAPLRSVLVSEIRTNDRGNGKNFEVIANPATRRAIPKLASGSDRALHVAYAFDESFEGEPSAFDYTMSLGGDETLEEFFNRSYTMSMDHTQVEKGEYVPSRDMVYRILRLAVATCFFGLDRHEIVMPDLPRRKIERRASQKNISHGAALKELAREINDTKMWTIGNEICLPTPDIARKERVEGEKTGNEWTHAAMRRGHLRWQRHGEGLKDKKLLLIYPTLCRPDLPWVAKRGYKIPDSNLVH